MLLRVFANFLFALLIFLRFVVSLRMVHTLFERPAIFTRRAVSRHAHAPLCAYADGVIRYARVLWRVCYRGSR